MKNKFFLFITLFAIGLLFGACQRDNSFTATAAPPDTWQINRSADTIMVAVIGDYQKVLAWTNCEPVNHPASYDKEWYHESYQTLDCVEQTPVRQWNGQFDSQLPSGASTMMPISFYATKSFADYGYDNRHYTKIMGRMYPVVWVHKTLAYQPVRNGNPFQYYWAVIPPPSTNQAIGSSNRTP